MLRASALDAEWAAVAAVAVTAKPVNELPHHGLCRRASLLLAWYYADDPSVGPDGLAAEVRAVVDYERASVKHGSPYCQDVAGASEDVIRLCHESWKCEPLEQKVTRVFLRVVTNREWLYDHRPSLKIREGPRRAGPSLPAR